MALSTPFHIYSMRQAIEEHFILDVLENYTTYKTCFQIAKNTPDNPEVPTIKAIKTIRRLRSFTPTTCSRRPPSLWRLSGTLQAQNRRKG